MTLKKGYVYEFFLDYDITEGTAPGAFAIGVFNTGTSAYVHDWLNKRYTVNYAQTTNGSSGYALIDLSSASADVTVQLKCTGIAGSSVTVASSNGGSTVKKFKKVTV